jgi:deoxyribonuclease V
MRSIAHPWDLPPNEAVVLQKQLATMIIRKSTIKIGTVETVAGIDTSYRNNLACAAVVVLTLDNLETVEVQTAVEPLNFPYIPGLLSFRESPAILAAMDNLKNKPDLLMFDGQGIAHQREFGIASHIGLLKDLPSIGCAKTKLVGQYDEPDLERGCYKYLKQDNQIIGAVVRTRSGVKPVFVSIGHRMNLRDCIRIVLKCGKGYRLPEPVRLADKLSREALRNSK